MKLTNTTSPALRTGLQGAVTAGMIRLVETVPDPDLVIGDGDKVILGTVLLAVVSFAMNKAEQHWGFRILPAEEPTP